MDIYEIIRRWHNHQSITQIADILDYDRKTVRKYIKAAQTNGISRKRPLPSKEAVIGLLHSAAYENRRKPTAQNLFKPYLPEISALLNDKQNPLKLKQAFEVICERHALAGQTSYPTFTRFVKVHLMSLFPQRSTCRIETDPGSEVQIDYAKMGLLYDPLSNKRRTVYAFIATLSHSRHKYVELVYKQDQVSFVNSNVKMLSYFGGAPRRILLDNLKSGVITPDLYDPHFNRSFREMAEYYDCFLDPCRVRRPQDKGKVERDVQTVRNQFRKLVALDARLDIAQANQKIKTWCIKEYGQRTHGTTHQKPYQVFLETEQPALKPLPDEGFQIPRWKEVTAHADHYVQFEKKAYSVPQAYVGKKLWLRNVNNIVQIFYQGKLIKQHVVSANYRHTDWSDFPKNVQAALDEGLPAFLQQKAAPVGASFQKLIRQTLQPHAFINLRKAQALIRLMDHWEPALLEKAATYALENRLQVSPQKFKQLLQRFAELNESVQTALPLSEQTLEFVREAAYFIHEL